MPGTGYIGRAGWGIEPYIPRAALGIGALRDQQERTRQAQSKIDTEKKERDRGYYDNMAGTIASTAARLQDGAGKTMMRAVAEQIYIKNGLSPEEARARVETGQLPVLAGKAQGQKEMDVIDRQGKVTQANKTHSTNEALRLHNAQKPTLADMGKKGIGNLLETIGTETGRGIGKELGGQNALDRELAKIRAAASKSGTDSSLAAGRIVTLITKSYKAERAPLLAILENPGTTPQVRAVAQARLDVLNAEINAKVAEALEKVGLGHLAVGATNQSSIPPATQRAGVLKQYLGE